jgi:Arc/MetJ-type ribon-helix-helix transcriptional regulator
MVLAVITVRIPEQVRRKMRRLKAVNWSAVVRDAIEARLDVEGRAQERDWDRVRRADKVAETVFREMHRDYGHIDFNSTEIIRYWRDRRYGSTYWTHRSS